MSNILTHANDIVNNRSEEKERMYGPFFETMERATRIYNEMNPQEKISTPGMYKALIALKLAREAYHHKEDNLLDAVAYMGSMNDYIESNVASNICPLTGAFVYSIQYSADKDLQALFDEAMRCCEQKGSSKILLRNYNGYESVLLAESYIEMDPEDGCYKWIMRYNKKVLDELNIEYYGKIQ